MKTVDGTARLIVDKLLLSLKGSTWAEAHPKALEDLREYSRDMELDVKAVLKQE